MCSFAPKQNSPLTLSDLSIAMDRIPPELWHMIGGYACLDGGATGCSLSLVSHAMRDVTRDVRYSSIVINSQESCLAFADLVHCLTHQQAIFHLLISIEFDCGAEFPSELTARLEDACAKILDHAAPTLVTLSHHLTSPLQEIFIPIVLGRFAELRFPSLHDLTLPELYFVPYEPTLPGLKRLHFANFSLNGPHGSHSSFWRQLETSFAPSLETVRVSNIGFAPLLSAVIRILLESPAPSEEERIPPAAANVSSPGLPHQGRLPHLEHVIIQLPNESNSGRYRPPAVLAALESIAASTQGKARQLSVVEGASGGRYQRDQAWRDWLDVMGGGDGPWAVRSDSTSTTSP